MKYTISIHADTEIVTEIVRENIDHDKLIESVLKAVMSVPKVRGRKKGGKDEKGSGEL